MTATSPDAGAHDARNFLVNILDGVLFTAGVAFFSHAGLVPLFVATLTEARWPIGLVTPVLMIGIALPQLLGAAFAASRPDFWRTLCRLALLPRLWVVVLAAVPFVPRPYTLPAFFVVWLAYALSLGFTIPVWTTFVAQVIPAGVRGRFFGTRTALGGVAALAGTAAASAVLATVPGRAGFALCFAIGAALLFASLLFFYATRHDWSAYEGQRPDASGFWADARSILATNRPFRQYLAARVFMTATVASLSFYAVHAVEAFRLTPAQGSLLALAIVFVPNLTAAGWGWLADRVGNRRVQVPAIAAAALANVVLAQTPPLAVYVACLVVAGLVNVVNQLVDNKLMMELDAGRCGTLLGVLNLALTPWLLVLPAIAGVLAELAGVPAVFMATGAALGLATAALALLRAPSPPGAPGARTAAR